MRMSTIALVTITALIAPESKPQELQPLSDSGIGPEPIGDRQLIDRLVEQVMPAAIASISPPEIVSDLGTDAIATENLDFSTELSTEDAKQLKILIAQVVDTSLNAELAANGEVLVGGDRLQKVEGTITILNVLLVLLASIPVVSILLIWSIRRWVVRDLVQVIHTQLDNFAHLEDELKDHHVKADSWMGELYRHLNIYKQHIRDELTTVHRQSEQSRIALKDIHKTKEQLIRQFREMLAEAEREKQQIFSEMMQNRPSQIIEALPVRLNSEPPQFSPPQLARTVSEEPPAPAPVPNPEEPTIEDYHGEAQKLTQLHRYDDAIAIYQKIIQLTSDNYGAWVKMGQLYVKLQNFQQAQWAYEQAITVDGDRDEAWYNLGNTLSKLERYSEALSCYEKALSIHPDRYETWHNQASILAKLGRYAESVQSYDRALLINPNIWEVWYQRGNLLGWLGDYEKAVVSYDRATSINAQKGELWYKQGLALAKLQRSPEALACYDIALSLGEQGEGLWRNRGVALQEMHRYEEAIAAYQQAIALQPQNLDLWLILAQLFQYLNRPQEALNTYQYILQLEPNHPQALKETCTILSQLNRDAVVRFNTNSQLPISRRQSVVL
ncbi:tetratricopeptide repeat protein [Roseofilum casamattae]|uniref:Tetratricopeptide repeat protein n=1 Tax=Roseofilum casamattae BLCC-M143 TaxID=3022442 RepID=A0ABT7BZ63_9CYAN|nr:tetratricopeptide repeat protein [Roseofilum casamattae]MDJ1184494.1 tetratricopeptide repeat protein [Roseofilum casamattae BLCC-M143]